MFSSTPRVLSHACASTSGQGAPSRVFPGNHSRVAPVPPRSWPLNLPRAQQSGASEQRRAKAPVQRRRKAVKDVTLRFPLEPGNFATDKYTSLTQVGLDDLMRMYDVSGFRVNSPEEERWVGSRSIADMVDGGTYSFKLVERPGVQSQLANLQGRASNAEAVGEAELRKFLKQRALEEHPGAAVEELPTAPWKDSAGKDLVQLDAGVVVRGVEGGGVLLLGEHKMAPRVEDVGVALLKVARIRYALGPSGSAALADVLQGVTKVKLYLWGEVVPRSGIKEDVLRDAEAVGVTLVLQGVSGPQICGKESDTTFEL